ncbi:hypothetical protein [Terrilactibacillus laevilacticus]|uniref:Uncharacterized protein n=1 Tax=Terrilactibacillus laevilacticus TaxID=1380157 RepID=A0ABW5PNM6_9BACI|nr:hypothetical protein [Terrilactibacillus laevilacticus]
MARNRNKEYKQGDRINIYLSRDITPEFIDWINKQSDLSSFFLYATRQLYRHTGNIDVSEVMPRKINFDLSAENRSMEAPENVTSPPAPSPTKDEEELIDESESSKTEEKWASIENLDDDFA